MRNHGIDTPPLFVVCGTLPSLVLSSRSNESLKFCSVDDWSVIRSPRMLVANRRTRLASIRTSSERRFDTGIGGSNLCVSMGPCLRFVASVGSCSLMRLPLTLVANKRTRSTIVRILRQRRSDIGIGGGNLWVSMGPCLRVGTR